MREENFLSYKKGDGTPSGNPVSISIGSQEKFSTLGQSAGQQGERPAATSLLKQCVTHLRDIVEALDNIHDNTPHRWSTELDDVHSSAESLLAMIKCQTADQAAQVLASPPPKCATCGGTGMVDDGEITCSEGGIPYENGPVKCVKDCPACKAQPSPVQPEEAPVIGCLCGMPMTEGHHSPDGCSSLEEFAPHLSAQAQAKQAERPEVVGYRSKESGMVYEQDYGLKNPEALTTVAECDRIVGELRAKAVQLREALEWRAENQAGQRELLRSVKAERDAALARVAEFEAQAQHSVPDGAADLCRFLAKLYCELDGLRYSTAKLPAEQIADALIFKWPVLQGARNQLNIKRISEQPYDESKLHSAIAAMIAAAPGKEVPQAWIDVQEERRRQITAEGWTPEHDDEHADGQMAQAAGCYALHAGGIGTDWPDGRQNGAALFWPWDKDSWKPTTPRRDLVKACALALAEIERLDRAAATQGEPRDA
ncbi:TPA: hypothetical protein NID21_000716 [Pseudomonas aeruginosa]|nr:hypothetical protein [Pseudomonas aeruginosa]